MKKFEFTEYNGHQAGYASWLLSSLLTDNEQVADACYRIFQQEPLEQAHTEFASSLRKMIAAWAVGEPIAYPDVIQAWAENTFGYLCKSAFWGPIYDALRGATPLPENIDEVTQKIYELFITVQWQDIVGDPTALVDRDGALLRWLENQLAMWVKSPNARQNTRTSLSHLATSFTQIAVDSVDFHRIGEYFQPEK